MTNRSAMRIAAAAGFLAVALGAFGAHALKEVLARNAREDTWETAVLYHFMHTLMLIWLAGRQPPGRGPFLCFLAGIVIFSGSLYLLAITNTLWLGAVTPFGGLAFLAGWLWLLISAPGSKDTGPAR